MGIIWLLVGVFISKDIIYHLVISRRIYLKRYNLGLPYKEFDSK